MDFNKLMQTMRDLDRPVGETVVPECGDPMGMTPPMGMNKPEVAPPSMSVNLNAQGMDNIESLMKLMTKVNPDMINQPAAPAASPMAMLTPPGPSISSIGDLGNLNAGPLKMLPDLGPEPEGHAEPDADNMGGPSDNDADNMPPMGDLDSDDSDDVTKAMGDIDGDGDHDMDDHEAEKESPEEKEEEPEEKEEAYGNSVAGSEPDYKGIDAAIPNGDDLNKSKKSFSGKPYRGDNPMAANAYESTDLRAQIRAELQQRLAEAKGAK